MTRFNAFCATPLSVLNRDWRLSPGSRFVKLQPERNHCDIIYLYLYIYIYIDTCLYPHLCRSFFSSWPNQRGELHHAFIVGVILLGAVLSRTPGWRFSEPSYDYQVTDVTQLLTLRTDPVVCPDCNIEDALLANMTREIAENTAYKQYFGV